MTSFWKGKKVFVTGHTGFKGSWLSLWLYKLGVEVIGYSLNPPTEPSMYETINLKENITSIIGDIRNKKKLEATIKKYNPEIIFHLAAQPLVRRSYIEPLETLDVNILGTANILDIARRSNSIKVVVNITSDKCYENKEWSWGYRETDPMGGYDPYSCSKSCSELITNSFRQSYFNEVNKFLASARAGNVIGGGDWSEDRLVPDIIKALLNDELPVIRNPHAVRPWQHVLEPLSGYMLLAEKMWKEGSKYAEGWNFGPENNHIIEVMDLMIAIEKYWMEAGEKNCHIDKNRQPYEAQFLKLDSSKAKLKLGWYPKLSMSKTLEWTVDWYKTYYNNTNMKEFSLKQIEGYERLRGSGNAL